MSLLGAWKGFTGELRGSIAQALFLDGTTYCCFRNVIVPTRRGTSQIDHVIVSRFGSHRSPKRLVAGCRVRGWSAWGFRFRRY
jgi:hypothetical protein